MALAVDWPTTLPKGFEADSYGHAPGSGIIRTDMDTGYAKTRLRYTAFMDEHSGRMIMTKALYDSDFLPFFRNDIARGTIPFDFPNPLDGGATEIEVRWRVESGSPPYSLKQYSPSEVEINFVLEELPK